MPFSRWWPGGNFSSVSRFGRSGGRGDRYGDRDRFVDDRYDGGRYGGDCYEIRETKYGGRDYVSDRYPVRSDRYGASDHYPTNGYDKERLYERDADPRQSSERYGCGGPVRCETKGFRDRAGPFGFRDRAGPYDHPKMGGGRPSSFDRY